MNERNMLKKCYFGSKKFQAVYIFTMIVCMFSFCYYNAMNETINKTEVIKAMNTYGEYHYMVEGIGQSKAEQLIDEKSTDKYELSECTEMKNARNMYVSSRFFSFTNYDIVKGRFPEDQTEVLAPAWYLYEEGIQTGKMIGSKIKVWDENAQMQVDKTVCGLYTIYDSNKKDDNVPTFILKKKKKMSSDGIYDLYVSTSGEEIGDCLQKLKNKYEWLSDRCMTNSNYLSAIHLTNEGKKQERKSRIIYDVILFFLVFFIFLIIKTIYKLFWEREKNTFAVVKFLGISVHRVRKYILLRTTLQLFLSELLGIASGFSLVYITLEQSMKSDIGRYPVRVYYSISPILILSLAILVLNVIVLIRELNLYMTATPYEIRSEKKRKLFFKQKSLFPKSFFPCTRMAYGNFKFYYGQKIMLLITIIVFIAMTVFLNYQKEQSSPVVKNNNQYEESFSVTSYFKISEEEIPKIKEKYNQLVDFLQKKNKTVYYKTGYTQQYEFPKKYLTNLYKEKLRSSANGRVQLHSGSQIMQMDIVCVGVSREMLREMTGKELSLDDDQILMYDHTIDPNSNEDVPIADMTGEEIELEVLAGEDFAKKKFRVASMADKICVYPELEKESLCLIMPIENYNKLLGDDYVADFYVKDMTEDLQTEIQVLLRNFKYIKVIDQKEEYAKIQFNNHQKNIMNYMLLILCNLMAGIGLVLQEIQDIGTRKKTNTVLRKLGVPKRKRNGIMILEVFGGNLCGMVLGLIFAKGMLLWMREINAVTFATLDPVMVCICGMASLGFSLISFLCFVKADKK